MDRRKFLQFVSASVVAAASGSALLTKAGLPEKKTGNVNIDYPLYWMDHDGNICRLVRVSGIARKGDLCKWTGQPNEVSRYNGGWPISGALMTDVVNGWSWMCIRGGPVPVRAL